MTDRLAIWKELCSGVIRQRATFTAVASCSHIIRLAVGVGVLQVVDKSRYAAGDNSLEREIQVLCKVIHPGPQQFDHENSSVKLVTLSCQVLSSLHQSDIMCAAQGEITTQLTANLTMCGPDVAVGCD